MSRCFHYVSLKRLSESLKSHIVAKIKKKKRLFIIRLNIYALFAKVCKGHVKNM